MNLRHDAPPKGIRLLAIPLAVALILTLFAWPQSELEPRGLPIGVAPSRHTAPMERHLTGAGDAFDVERYRDAAAARAAIEDREVYGAFVPTADGAALLTASAGSPAVAAQLQQAFEPQIRAGRLKVEDVVASDSDDPRGAAFNAAVLPLLIAGLLTGLLVTAISRPGLEQVLLLAGGSALAGGAATAIGAGWLGVLGDHWPATAGVLSLLVLAVAATVAGMRGVLGHAGVGLSALLFVLVGNPWSGLATAPEMLPRPIGAIGQLLPPGAGGNALRSTAFFDGGGVTPYLVVLAAWTVLGLTLVSVAARRSRAQAPAALEAQGAFA